MKRFFIVIIIIMSVLFGGTYLIYCSEFKVSFHNPESTTALFKTDEKNILKMENGKYVPMEIKSVELSSSMPSHYASEFAPTKEDYLRWLIQIAEIGANTISVCDIMDDDFYNAFYQYNKNNKNPLYLIQGIRVLDDVNNGTKTAYSKQFMGSLKKSGKMAVDIIYGKKIDIVDGEVYLKDVSQWVIGYMVGDEWNKDTVAYTDHHAKHNQKYAGKYFSTTADSTAFESMLAQVMDEIVQYENKKYDSQHIIGFVNSPSTDFLEYSTKYAAQLSKYAYVDGENILPSKSLISGYFVGYNLYDFCDDFSKYLVEKQKKDLAPVIKKINKSDIYGGYLKVLSHHHSVPIMVTGYGFSTSRGVSVQDKKPLTEKEQGKRIIEVWQNARAAGFAGVSISTWQDEWERRTWNTSFAIDRENNYLWHDLQSEGQNYGIMAFLPGEESCVNIDGNFNEWKNEKTIFKSKEFSLYLKSDHEALYLMAKGKNISEHQKIYIPFDTNENIGYNHGMDMKFNRGVDHILCIDGKKSTKLYVHDRYNAMRVNFNYEQTGVDPYFKIPKNNEDSFSVVKMATKNTVLIDPFDLYNLADEKKLARLKSYETGIFHYGNGNRNNKDYDSLADFHFGKNGVELRIPWQLLNVSSPTDGFVHDDYYENYGVEPKKINSFYIGVGNGQETIDLMKVDFPNISENVKWHEHLKQSYDIIRNHWNN